MFCLSVCSWHICPHKMILTTKYFSICSFLLYTPISRDAWMSNKATPTLLLPSLQICFHAATIRRGQFFWFWEGSHPVMDPSQTILQGRTLSFPILYCQSHYDWEKHNLCSQLSLSHSKWFLNWWEFWLSMYFQIWFNLRNLVNSKVRSSSPFLFQK